MLDRPSLDELEQTSEILNLPISYVRKDFYLTKAIHALSQVKNDYFELIFQGGTSLAKGYKIISRLSEDSDFRIKMKDSCKKLGKNIIRSYLRDFRYQLIRALEDVEIKVNENSIKVFF